MASEAKNNNAIKSVYVYDIPFLERKQLCRILDLDDNWKELAGLHMGFCVFDILVSNYFPLHKLLLAGENQMTIFKIANIVCCVK